MKIRKMFSFPPLTNSSVTIGLSFIFVTNHISNHISYFLSGLYSSVVLQILCMSFEHSIKGLKPIKFFKPIVYFLLIDN